MGSSSLNTGAMIVNSKIDIREETQIWSNQGVLILSKIRAVATGSFLVAESIIYLERLSKLPKHNLKVHVNHKTNTLAKL